MDDLRKPILPGKGASDYERYLRTDELLSLQKTAGRIPAPRRDDLPGHPPGVRAAAERRGLGTGTGAAS